MPALENLTNEELAQKIAEREDFLKKVVEFAEGFMSRNGIVLRRDDRGDHVFIETELKTFGEFAIKYTSGHSMLGGSDIKIWYKETSGRPVPVLYIRWGAMGEITTKRFSSEVAPELWVEGFVRVMDEAEDILKANRENKAEAERRAELAKEQSGQRENLLGKARELGF